jgi:hypothetical protein
MTLMNPRFARGFNQRHRDSEIVDRMNGRGAGVPEKDIPAMVDYLAKMYGVPN